MIVCLHFRRQFVVEKRDKAFSGVLSLYGIIQCLQDTNNSEVERSQQYTVARQLVQSYTIKNNNKDIISQCVSFPFQPLFLCHKHYSTANLQKYLMYLHLQKTVSVSANPEKLYAHALALCKNWTEIFNTVIGGKFYSKAQIF